MPDRPKKIIIYLYNRLADPLIQGNIFLYLRDLIEARHKGYRYAFVTYEDPDKRLQQQETEALRKWMETNDVEWHHVTWHKGTNMFMKAWDVIAVFLIMLRLRLRGFRYIVTLASVAGAFAYIYSRILRFRHYLYQYEPHSEYGLDSGAWAATSPQFRIQNQLEKRSALAAQVISSGTEAMRARLTSWNVKADFFRIPSVADDRRFVYDHAGGMRIRQELDISPQQHVMIYPGKFGFTYYVDEAFLMFRQYLDLDQRLVLLLITSNPLPEVEQLIEKHGLPKDRIRLLGAVPYADMPAYLSAADIALINVIPGPSKKYVSNIKVGEYLCTGLPYLIVRGVSEDDTFAEQHNVGVVVDRFDHENLAAAYPKFAALLAEDPQKRKQRCREAGVSYRGYTRLRTTFREALDTLTTY